ncbi:hypothetical protein HHI36_019859 [Cryptolaemus montrouzieri]|uniref:AMP-dependent synthetase/ligase domain-containing protein n=1 Tax=Cryptolaemus montrouzieri TaxID=559131 RepID=A0ABD2N8V9_9CUCU
MICENEMDITNKLVESNGSKQERDNGSSDYHPFIVKAEDLKEREFFGIGYEIFWCMKKYENNIAQYDLKSGIKETYASMLQRSIRTALRLKSKKISEDSIIGICAANHTDSVIPLIAAFFLGYRVVTFDVTQSVTDISYLIQQVTPTIMFIDEEAVSTMEVAMTNSQKYFEFVVFGTSAKYSVMNDYSLRVDGNEEEIFEPVRTCAKKTALILFSSGTTGMPKGICLPHSAILYQSYGISCAMNLSQNSVLLYFTPLHWISSPNLFISTILSGASRVVCTLHDIWRAIDKYKVIITPEGRKSSLIELKSIGHQINNLRVDIPHSWIQ